MRKLNLTLMLLMVAIYSFGQNVPAYVPTNGLVGWWPFNGNANDESGNGNNGTVNGATLTSDRFGMVNGAYNFITDNQNINCGNSSSLGLTTNSQLTINFWTFSLNNRWPFISKYQHLISNNSNYGIGNNNQNFIVTGNGQDAHVVTSNNSVNWNNISVIFDGVTDSVSFYVNGQLLHKDSISLSNNISNRDLLFGPRFNSTVNTYQSPDGKLDDIGIWNRALSQQEITALYNGNICYQTISVTDTLFINTNITGFNPVTYENTIRIWPNPTNDHITIDAGDLNAMNGYSVRIINSLGQQMFQSAINQQQFYLDLSTWTGNGMYFVHITDPNGNIIDIKKIVLR